MRSLIRYTVIVSVLLIILGILDSGQVYVHAQTDDEAKKAQLQRCESLYGEYLEIGETKFIERYMHFRNDRNCVKLYQDALWDSDREDRDELLILLLYEIDGDSKTLKERSIQNPYQISNWMKNDAKRWYQGQSSDSKFAFVLRTMVESKIIQAKVHDVFFIPNWIKKSTQWWVEEKISDADYIRGLEYLMKEQIIMV